MKPRLFYVTVSSKTKESYGVNGATVASYHPTRVTRQTTQNVNLTVNGGDVSATRSSLRRRRSPSSRRTRGGRGSTSNRCTRRTSTTSSNGDGRPTFSA